MPCGARKGDRPRRTPQMVTGEGELIAGGPSLCGCRLCLHPWMLCGIVDIMQRRPTTQDVTWFLDQNRNGQLQLTPPYQRRSVWTTKDRRFFSRHDLQGLSVSRNLSSQEN
jgi:hypothetical protein